MKEFFRRNPVAPVVRLNAVGDVGFSGRVRKVIDSGGGEAIFESVIPYLSEADLVFCNLETPLLQGDAKEKLFAGEVRDIDLLSRAGFTLINLANNHILDHGNTGLESTIKACESAGLQILGAGSDGGALRQPVRTDIGGLRIGWLACARTLQDQSAPGAKFWEFDPDELLEAVTKARVEVDIVVVSIHIGLMYLDYPEPAHKALAETLVNAGAQLVLMHHAHVLQGIQIVEDRGVICYNMGNFLLDWQEGNVKAEIMVDEQNEGAVFSFELDKAGVRSVIVYPTVTDQILTVVPAVGDRASKIISRLERISNDLDGDYLPLFHQQRAERNAGVAVDVFIFHLRRKNWRFVIDFLKQVRSRHLLMGIRWMATALKNKFSSAPDPAGNSLKSS